jgi:hypothetical protein
MGKPALSIAESLSRAQTGNDADFLQLKTNHQGEESDSVIHKMLMIR